MTFCKDVQHPDSDCLISSSFLPTPTFIRHKCDWIPVNLRSELCAAGCIPSHLADKVTATRKKGNSPRDNKKNKKPSDCLIYSVNYACKGRFYFVKPEDSRVGVEAAERHCTTFEPVGSSFTR